MAFSKAEADRITLELHDQFSRSAVAVAQPSLKEGSYDLVVYNTPAEKQAEVRASIEESAGRRLDIGEVVFRSTRP